MFATIRRYDGVDRIARPSSRARSTRPSCRSSSKLPGFKGYYLIDAGNGVFSSLGLFETPEQGMESTKLVTTWIREEKLETILPNEPKITSGKIVAPQQRQRSRGRSSSTSPHSAEGRACQALRRTAPTRRVGVHRDSNPVALDAECLFSRRQRCESYSRLAGSFPQPC